MSEPSSKPPTPSAGEAESLPVSENGSGPAARDDTPTIISRAAPRISPDDAVAHSLRGRRLAHFELIDKVGVGGMAAVLKARDLQLDRTVALKILPPDLAVDAESIRRFHQEARAAAKLDHENIARVYFCGEDQGLHFIAFEFVHGDNLRTVLERRGRLPVGESLHYLIQIASGLAHAGHRGVVHRDIKPSNIVITPNGRAKLVDMGLARSAAAHDHQLTQSGVTLGTFDYISPEQALEPRDADVRSDIYSLGCTFYHMLTGQPPVPEGTAARKLHHHQHVAPVDPRELNPEVPDEVAAILAKMMAKSPAERYQRPEPLVQHLLHAAQAASGLVTEPNGAASHDGMVMVDAALPLPAPPARPLLLGAVALAAVVTLVVLLSQAPTASRSGGWPASRPVSLGEARDKPPRPGGPEDVGSVKPTNPGSGATTPTTVPVSFTYTNQGHRELRDFLRKLPSGSEAEIVLAGDLILPGDGATSSDEPGLVFKGRKITFRAQGQQTRPTIWFAYDGLPRQSSIIWAALLLEADEVHLKGLRLVIDAREAQQRMMGVLLRGGRRHLVEDCEFVQAAPAYRDEQRLGSLVVDATARSDSRPEAVVRDCVFLGAEETEGKSGQPLLLRRLGRGGQDALTRIGPARLSLQHCAFGPHLACVRLEGSADGAEQAVSLEHCSALLGEGSSAFLAAREATGQLRVRTSLFTRADNRAPVDHTQDAVLIRQGDEDSTGLGFSGEDNRYHQLDGYWLAQGADEPLGWADFQTRFAAGAREDRSLVLDASPWLEDEPLTLLGTLRLARAFQVQGHARELRVSGDDRKLIGVERCAGVSYVTALPALDRKPPSVRKEKIFDPRLSEAGNGQYPTLRQALDDAQNGDVILVRADGLVPVKPTRLDRIGLEVTIKAAPGYRPVLTPDTQDREATIFHVQEGKLTLRQLAFRLQPAQGSADAGATQAVVTAAAEGGCRFEDCVVTLGEPRGVSLAVVVLSDPGVAMMKKPPLSSPGPRISFENCLLRGKGDLLWSRSARAFRLEAANTLAALAGSLVHVDGPRDDGVLAEGKAPMAVDLKNVTTCLQDNLFNLRGAKDLKTLAPVQARAEKCLFVALAGKPLIHLDGMDMTEDRIKERLSWEGTANAYGNFLELLDQQPPAPGMRPPAYGEDNWKRLTGESDARFTRVKFNPMPEATSLGSVKPAQFKVADLADYGVNTDNLPPPPPDDHSSMADMR